MTILDRNGSPFAVGARVVSYTHVDRFPHFQLPPGVTGTVVNIEDGHLDIRVDLPWRAAVGAEWEWCVNAVSDDIDNGEQRASDEWVVTAPPTGTWPYLRAPTNAHLRDAARKYLDHMVDNMPPDATERTTLEIAVKHGADHNVLRGFLDDLLLEGAEGGELLARTDAEVRRVAAQLLARMRRNWTAKVAVFLRVEVDVDVADAATEEEARMRAPIAAGDWAEECEVMRVHDVVGSEIASFEVVSVKEVE
jgi:hypothetical protein